jgi:alpha-galactosidase
LEHGEQSLPGRVERRSFELLSEPGAPAGAGRCDLTVHLAKGAPVQTLDTAPTCEITTEPGRWTAHWHTSAWGEEFTPRAAQVDTALTLEVRSGRSSKGLHPLVWFSHEDGRTLVVSPAWSGNWSVTATPDPDGGIGITAGINPWRFSRTLTDHQPFVAPAVHLAWGPDMREARAALARAVGSYVSPDSHWTQTIPTAWNHWWPYEDTEIDQDVFLANARVARSVGLDVATLDAGWFGRPAADSFWERERGDWDQENTSRFPAGTGLLATETRDLGLAFGLWLEGEAVGADAKIRHERPELMARRDHDPPAEPVDPEDPGWLGQICLGSPEARHHLRRVLRRAVARTGCAWLKLDFNLDPGAGCSRTDHGHGAGDGLYEHYLGLYSILDELRTAHPEMIIEGCSSGGLRIDLGLASHLHTVFLSDPDWTEFHLQTLWGASGMLPAASIFHFAESQWRSDHPRQLFDPKTATRPELARALRAVMLHRFAVSWRLVDLRPDQLDDLRAHLEIYRRWAVPLIRNRGVIVPLTAQPLQNGHGERFPAFQLTDGQDSLIAAFRLDGSTHDRRIMPYGVNPRATYEMRLLGPDADLRDLPSCEGQPSIRVTGADLAEGFRLEPQSDALSWLITLTELSNGVAPRAGSDDRRPAAVPARPLDH